MLNIPPKPSLGSSKLPNVPPLRDHLRHLPGGLKLWGCYILAHQSYLEKDYAGALAMAEMGLALSPEPYPIAEVYTRLVAVMALMNLKEPERARAHMEACPARRPHRTLRRAPRSASGDDRSLFQKGPSQRL